MHRFQSTLKPNKLQTLKKWSNFKVVKMFSWTIHRIQDNLWFTNHVFFFIRNRLSMFKNSLVIDNTAHGLTTQSSKEETAEHYQFLIYTDQVGLNTDLLIFSWSKLRTLGTKGPNKNPNKSQYKSAFNLTLSVKIMSRQCPKMGPENYFLL